MNGTQNMNMAGPHNGNTKGKLPMGKATANDISNSNGSNPDSSNLSNGNVHGTNIKSEVNNNPSNIGTSNIGSNKVGNNIGTSNIGSNKVGSSNMGTNVNISNNGQHMQKGFNTMILPVAGQIQNQPQFQQQIPGQIQQQPQPHLINQQFNGAPNGPQMMMGNGGNAPNMPNSVNLQQPNKMGQFTTPNSIPGTTPTNSQVHPSQLDPNFALQQQQAMQNQPQNNLHLAQAGTPGISRSQPSFSGRSTDQLNKQQVPQAMGKKPPFNRPPGQSPIAKPSMLGPNTLSKEQQEQFQNEINAKIFKRNLGNAGVIRILDLIDQICNESIENLSNIEYWQRVVQVFFLSNSIFRFCTPPKDKIASLGTTLNTESNKLENSILNGIGDFLGGQYELTAITAPRFFVTSILSGNLNGFQINLPSLKFQVLNSGSIFIASRISIQYNYIDGSLANVLGNLKLLMNREFRIECIDVKCLDYQPTISYTSLENHWQKYFESKPQKKVESSNETKKGLFQSIYSSSEAIKNAASGGMSNDSSRILQISDVMSQLRSLMGFSMINNVTSPLKALEMFIAANNHPQMANSQRASFSNAISSNNGNANSSQQKRVSDISPLTTFSEEPKMMKKRKLSSVGSNSESPLIGSERN